MRKFCEKNTEVKLSIMSYDIMKLLMLSLRAENSFFAQLIVRAIIFVESFWAKYFRKNNFWKISHHFRENYIFAVFFTSDAVSKSPPTRMK